jgi:Pro-kumamolisin, activation domain/Bacterial Ig-like domain (group 3)
MRKEHPVRRPVFALCLSTLCLLIFLILSPLARAQSVASRIVAPIDGAKRTTLTGNTHPLARAAFDQGALSETTPLHRMQLVLSRSAEQQAALEQLLEQQQDRSSSSFHQWLTPQSFGAAFGLSDRDLSTVTAWLAAQGFTGIHANPGRTAVEFSGAAGIVQNAFHTAMHRYLVNGQPFFGNASDPQIPAALAPVVAGVASLNNFALQPPTAAPLPLVRDNKTGVVTHSNALPTASLATASSASSVHAEYTTTSTTGQPVYAVTPADLAAIYNFAGLLSSGTNGTGQAIAVVGDSDINADDFLSFRMLFNLPIGVTTTPTHTQYLNIIFNGADPGVTPDESKGAADTQWTGAVAPNATIDYVISETTSISQGSDLSAQYIIDNNLAPILVDTFNRCEASAGAAYNTFISNLWQQAAAQGISVVVAAGDNGSAGCDTVGASTATGGLAVNAIASTSYNVAVGGTDITGGWSTTNSANQSSAPGYLTETAWNDNLGPQAMAPIVRGGSGGASSCATGSGTSCAGTPKPNWQTGVNGIPTDSVRDLPDLSLFAGDGAYGALYFVCQQDALATPGTACALGTPSTTFVGAGGTSFSAAAFAGMLALVNQKMGASQGNPNYTLYKLAANQQQAGTACAANGPPASSCIFNDITTDNNEMPCASGSPNCSGITLSGFTSNAGYDLATGLGSINVQNLVTQWSTVTYSATTTTLTLSANGTTTGGGNSTPLTITHGTAVTAAGAVTANSGTPTGQVSINANAANGSIGAIPLANGDFSQAFRTFPGSGTLPGTTTPASYQVKANYGGDGTFAPSQSIPVNLIVTPEPSTTTVTVIDTTPNKPTTNQPVTNVPYGEILDVQVKIAGQSGQGVATGNVALTDNTQPLYGGTFALNSSGYADAFTTSLTVAASPHVFAASYAGDASFNSSTSPTSTLTIVKAPTTASIAPNANPVSDATTETFTVIIGTTGYGFAAPTGVVTVTGSNGTVLGSATLTGVTNGGQFDFSVAYITIPAGLITTGNTATVNYPGDTNYLGSTAGTSPITVTVSNLPPTTTTLSVTPLTVAPTGSITLTAAVTSTVQDFTGSMSFFIDGIAVPLVAVGTPATTYPVNADGTVAPLLLPVAGFGPGQHIASAVFSGDGTHKASMSAGVTFTITAAAGTTPSTTAITLNPAAIPPAPTTVVQGTVILVTVQVAPTGPPVPTGTVQILIDGNVVGTATKLDPTGAATYTLPTDVIPVGTHQASIFYSGDTVYAQSFSLSVPFVITAAGNTLTQIVISNVPALVGLGITFPFTATITPSSPAPTGTTELIIDKGTPQAQVALPPNDPATLQLNTTGLALGPHTVAVYYSGNSILSAATSSTASFTIIPQSSAFTLSPTTASAHIPIEGLTSNATTFTVTPTVGGTFSVAFACTSGLPSNITCSFSPATVNLTGVTPGTTNLTFVVGSYPQADNHRLALPGGWYGLGGGVSLAGVLLLIVPRRRRGLASLLGLLTVIALGAVTITATGCGSGYQPQQGPFAVTVTVTSSISVLGPATQTATVNLTIGGLPAQ